MNAFPIWLNEMVVVDPWTQNTFDELYAIFRRDLVLAPAPRLNGQRIWIANDLRDGKEECFWHITHKEDEGTGIRMPNPRRCERLPWVRCMIDHAVEPEILIWDYEEPDHAVKTHIWLRDHDFLVVLKKLRRPSYRLVTAFYIEHPESYRRSLESKYRRRIR